jgi:hypothetical protein
MLHSFIIDHQIAHVLNLLILVLELVLEEVYHFLLSAHPDLKLSDFLFVLNHLDIRYWGVF